ncbi:MAG: phospho-N-acetylmuramoyl-pentapeptide-transferase [Acidobacteria bacterium]|nr:phospho-N-acetylmuramoyl-pentapeptide-transferase [Acidobacteriota bacterium]
MLYLIFYPLHDYGAVFNVFRYITFRTAYASLTALFLSFLLGPWMIRKLRDFQVGQQIREEGPQSHRAKAGTPTMGGVLILASILIPTLLWADLTNPHIWTCVFSLTAFGAIGFLDDYAKVRKQKSLGWTGKQKIVAQIAISIIIGVFLFYMRRYGLFETHLTVPFFKNWTPDLGWLYLAFIIIVIVGSSNAVNLTDGLDGLAIGTFLVASSAFTVLAYIAGHSAFSSYLNIMKISQAGEITIFCGSMVGASLGFLWYNAYPAEIFMGDVGSLALGGALGTVAVLIKQEVLLLSVGGLFVIEALSVILQVGSFKLTGQRIFKMAPLHHHFELSGWKEPKVVVRFWIAAIIFALLSLSTLKLR